MKEYRLKELLSFSDIEYTSDCYAEFEFPNVIQLRRGLFAHKGDVIGKIEITVLSRWSSKSLGVCQLIAPDTAVYDFTVLIGIISPPMPVLFKKLIDENAVFCRSYEDLQENAEDIIKRYCNYTISDDVFNGDKKILWNYSFPSSSGMSFNKRNAFQLRFFPDNREPRFKLFPFVRLDKAKEQFVFQYDKKEFSTHKFVKGDSFHFVFENNRHLEYKIKKAAAVAEDSDFRQVTFAMLPQDIQLFASENLIGIRCEFQNGDAPLELKKMNDLASLTFKLYFQEYIKALGECGVQIDSDVYDEENQRDNPKGTASLKDSSCFVYLMKDETNGYHKIGISNKPEYRERTLQSEKPTIALLCAKEFPTRIIAEAIESALHKTFEDKRLRGEWFALDEKDVLNVIKTLS